MAEQTSTPKPVATFTYRDEKFTATRKPSPFLIAELSSTDDGDASALGVIVDFFRETMETKEFRRFRRHALADTADTDEGFKALAEALQEVVAQSMGRPTESSES